VNSSVLAFAARMLTAADVTGRRVVEAGALDVNGSVRQHVLALGPRSYTGTDIQAGPGVDVVCAAGDLEPGSADVLVCTEMLEHVQDWRPAVIGLVRAVAPGGVLLLTTRSIGFPYHHPSPGDFWRFSPAQVETVLKAAGLDVAWCAADEPESPGVLAFARKPAGWPVPAGMAAALAAVEPRVAVDWHRVAAEAVAGHGALQKPAELAILLAHLDVMCPEVIVEIGSDAGGTLWAWSQLPGPPQVIGVDLPGGPYSTGRQLDAHGARVVVGDSHRPETRNLVRRMLPGGAADVLFIDGDHTYAGARADYQAYRPLVREGGLIVLHDIVAHPSRPDVGVHRLWQEITWRQKGQEIIAAPEEKWAGIGIVENVPAPVREPVLLAAR
jgi:predicted O-methyltransferase YrrM